MLYKYRAKNVEQSKKIGFTTFCVETAATFPLFASFRCHFSLRSKYVWGTFYLIKISRNTGKWSENPLLYLCPMYVLNGLYP